MHPLELVISTKNILNVLLLTVLLLLLRIWKTLPLKTKRCASTPQFISTLRVILLLKSNHHDFSTCPVLNKIHLDSTRAWKYLRRNKGRGEGEMKLTQTIIFSNINYWKKNTFPIHDFIYMYTHAYFVYTAFYISIYIHIENTINSIILSV